MKAFDNKKIKPIHIIIFFVVAIPLFLRSFFYDYKSLKKFYNNDLNGTVNTIQLAGSTYWLYLNNNSNKNFLFIGKEEVINKISVGDSISKKSKSDEIKVYRKKDSTQWKLKTVMYIEKETVFYNYIVK